LHDQILRFAQPQTGTVCCRCKTMLSPKMAASRRALELVAAISSAARTVCELKTRTAAAMAAASLSRKLFIAPFWKIICARQ
jgi:hypothetical protein